jgi:uncharacterized membrane protein
MYIHIHICMYKQAAPVLILLYLILLVSHSTISHTTISTQAAPVLILPYLILVYLYRGAGCEHTSAFASIRQYSSAYFSISY